MSDKQRSTSRYYRNFVKLFARYRADQNGTIAVTWALLITMFVFMAGMSIDLQIVTKQKQKAQLEIDNILLSSMFQSPYDELQDTLGSALSSSTNDYQVNSISGRTHNGAHQVFLTVDFKYEPVFPDPLRLWSEPLKLKTAGQY